MPGPTPDAVRRETARAVRAQSVIDIHTHLFAPRFNRHAPFLLTGIEELLDYHYLRAELLRALQTLDPRSLAALPKRDRADLTWRTLFRERAPVSESTRGVLTTLAALGLDTNEPNLDAYRHHFATLDPDEHVNNVMRLAGVERITMTNELFDDRERAAWLDDNTLAADPRFATVIRIDALFADPQAALARLADWGHKQPDPIHAVRAFLNEWVDRTNPVYAAASLPPITTNTLTPSAEGDRILHEAVLPTLDDRKLPLALMIGARRAVNPALADAGDASGPSNLTPLADLCTRAPRTTLLVTMLAREDQHSLCVLARKFANLVPFGCWWFLNTPTAIAEITRTRLELLGSTFIPQHSDARVLEQLIYKWSHTRDVLADVLADHFATLATSGPCIDERCITREVDRLFRTNALERIPY